jgi:mono/diheme cytochrome c family protein
MKLSRTVFFVAAGLFLVGAIVLAIGQAATNPVVATPPIFVPDVSHANSPLPDGILVWDALTKSTDAPADQQQVHFVFGFTNISSGNVAILDARGSCSCTATELPQKPWIILPGTNGQIGATVDLRGKSGTLFKSITVSTDKGTKLLMMQINMLPPVIPQLTEEERAKGIAAAKVDRQAVFHGDCVKCHANNIEGKYGKQLYDSVCAICHDAEHRDTMVPDLHHLKTPTNDEFWRTWIAHGKPGSLMPAFATSDGGPLTDIQIAILAAYLNTAIPYQVPMNK